MSEAIKSFRELHVYQVAFEVQQSIFKVTKGFPKEEAFSLTDQFRRASRSIGATIAEAWQKRRYKAHFVSKLSDADGEQAETQHWIVTAFACGYISKMQQNSLLSQCEEVGRKLGKMLAEPEKWCPDI
jgi:four helix bundle protein